MTHRDRFRGGLVCPCGSTQDLYLCEPRSIHQCYRKWYDADSLSHSCRRCLLCPLTCNIPQLVRTTLFGLSLCSQRCCSSAFLFFGLDVTDILGSFEGCDCRAVVEVSPIARELLSLQNGHLYYHESTFLFCILVPLVVSFILYNNVHLELLLLLFKWEGEHVCPLAFFPTVEAMSFSIAIVKCNAHFFADGWDSGRVTPACTSTASPSVIASTSSRIPSSSLDEGNSSIISGLMTLLLAWRFIVPQ